MPFDNIHLKAISTQEVICNDHRKSGTFSKQLQAQEEKKRWQTKETPSSDANWAGCRINFSKFWGEWWKQQPMSVKSTVDLSIHGGQFWFLDRSKNKLITRFYPKQIASATPTLAGYLGNRSLSIRSFSFKRKIQMIPKLKLIMQSFVRTWHFKTVTVVAYATWEQKTTVTDSQAIDCWKQQHVPNKKKETPPHCLVVVEHVEMHF